MAARSTPRAKPLTPALSPEYRGEGVSHSRTKSITRIARPSVPVCSDPEEDLPPVHPEADEPEDEKRDRPLGDRGVGADAALEEMRTEVGVEARLHEAA